MEKVKNKGKFEKYGCTIAFLTYLIVVISFLCIRHIVRDLRLDSVKDHLGEYASTSSLEAGIYNMEYIKGKLIAIDMTHKTAVGEKNFDLDDLYFKLPKELCATQPEEVTTIVLLKWKTIPWRVYENLASYRVRCEMVIVDKSIPAKIVKKDFEAKEKNWVYEKIVDYLLKLPRK